MEISDNLYCLNYILNEQLLLAEALDYNGYNTFIDPLTGIPVEGWLIKMANYGYAKKVADDICKNLGSTDYRPRFYIQEPESTIGWHKDRGTLCSLNFILSNNPCPISFRDGDYFYKTALLNTQVEHAVFNASEKRILYKISIFDLTYQEVKNVLQSTIHR